MRKPSVAGFFYERSESALRQQIEHCFRHPVGPGSLPELDGAHSQSILGLVSPHAGYMFSGPVAAHGFYRLSYEEKPEVVVILGPNHHGVGAAIALSKQEWLSPLGSVKVDTGVAEGILSAFPEAQWDDAAHLREHSVEVQVPFLQYIYGDDFRIVPIVLARQNASTSRVLGQAIASALEDKRGLIIASSDFTHYESQSSASRKDKMALAAVANMNPEQLEETVNAGDISMCGPGPIMTMLTACTLMGAKTSTLLSYATSGDITGDPSRVVGYASVEVTL